ncbi:MAG: hypothetical protein AWT59_2783 [Candidatus Gallionella acididurans]|uniref:Uncharacterized protein n=1 Tax=Candidatus Gallionella acididurans TaxID=1796491 RepID=A0A139BQL8_9PROT|nr:MAG: hypothetical protein AWT59_2783 [Candidatus Gallionella acididurans]
MLFPVVVVEKLTRICYGYLAGWQVCGRCADWINPGRIVRDLPDETEPLHHLPKVGLIPLPALQPPHYGNPHQKDLSVFLCFALLVITTARFGGCLPGLFYFLEFLFGYFPTALEYPSLQQTTQDR